MHHWTTLKQRCQHIEWDRNFMSSYIYINTKVAILLQSYILDQQIP